MGLDHPDHIFGTILDVYAAAGSTRTNDFIDNSRPCDHIRKLCGSSHNTPKFVTSVSARGSRAPSLRLVSFYVFYAFPWHFSGIIWHPGGIPWNAMKFHGMPWTLCYFHGISVELYGSRWNAMEFHRIQKIGTLTKLVSGSKPWKYM